MKFIVSLAVVTMILSGCQTRSTYTNFSSSKIKEDYRTVYGKVNITYRDHKFDRPCTIYFNEKPRKAYTIDKSSLLLTTLPVGKNNITSLKCSIGPRTIWKFEDLAFKINEKTSATDIGNININLGDNALHDKAITNVGADFIDSIALSLASQKFKDAFDISITHTKLSSEERKNIIAQHPELNKASNGKYIQAVKPTVRSVKIEGYLPKAYRARAKN